MCHHDQIFGRKQSGINETWFPKRFTSDRFTSYTMCAGRADKVATILDMASSHGRRRKYLLNLEAVINFLATSISLAKMEYESPKHKV